MSIKAYESLFRLIQSMGKAEKRYFRIYASMHVIGKQNGYMRLYEYIARQKQYNEKLLKRDLRREVFIKRLPAVKNHLYTLILKSMRSFHANSSAEVRLACLLEDAEHLFDKALYVSSMKVLEKAHRLAVAFDKFDFLIQILRRKIRVIYLGEGYSSRASQIKIKRCAEEMANAVRQNNNLAEYEESSIYITLNYHREGKPSSKQQMKKLAAIMKSPMYRNENYPLSFPATISQYDKRGFYADMRGDFKKAYEIRKKSLELMEAHPEKLQEYGWTYLTVLNNLIIQVNHLQLYREAFPLIEKMKNIPNIVSYANAHHFAGKIFAIASVSEINACMASGQYEKGRAIIPEIESGMNKYESIVPLVYTQQLYFNMAQVHFIFGDFRRALSGINRILLLEKGGNQELMATVRIFSIILHYEMHHEEFLPYLNRSTRQFLIKSKRLLKIETALLRFFTKVLPSLSGKKSVCEAFRKLKSEIMEIAEDPFESRMMVWFDLISWLDSKIQDRPIRDIIREKSAKG